MRSVPLTTYLLASNPQRASPHEERPSQSQEARGEEHRKAQALGGLSQAAVQV